MLDLVFVFAWVAIIIGVALFYKKGEPEAYSLVSVSDEELRDIAIPKSKKTRL